MVSSMRYPGGILAVRCIGMPRLLPGFVFFSFLFLLLYLYITVSSSIGGDGLGWVFRDRFCCGAEELAWNRQRATESI